MSLLPSDFVLTAVEYRLFDFEVEHVKDRWINNSIELDGELILHGYDGSHHFLSWQQNGDEDEVAISEKDFFVSQSEMTNVNATSQQLWATLIGKRLIAEYSDGTKKIIKLITGSHHLFCCAYGDENWGSDMVYIGHELPALA